MDKFFRVPFALSGDQAAVPDAAAVDGSVSYMEGYGLDYELPKTDPDSKNIERQKMNNIFFSATKAIGELQGQGIPDFITTALNGGSPFPYAINALARYTDGVVYRSLVAANTALPTDATKWASEAGAVKFDRTVTTYPDRTVGYRIHRDYVNISDIGGADPTGTVDNRAIILAAKATGKLVRIDGTYRCDGDIPDALAGFVGDGARQSRIIFNASHGFTFANAVLTGRKIARFENFAIDSLSNSCDDKFAFYAPGVAGGAAPVYNSGANIEGVVVGDDGRFGGYAYLKDCFYFDIKNARGTNLSRGVQFVGSNVGHRITGFRANNDSAATVLLRYGLSTESASYSIGTLAPENIDVEGFQFIRCARGVNHTSGLFVRVRGLDTEADEFGAWLNAEITLADSLVAPGPAAAAWTGIFAGSGIATPDAGFWLSEIDVNLLRAPATPGSSFGIDIGNGADPVRSAVVDHVRMRGIASSLLIGVRSRGCRFMSLSDAAIRSTVVTSSAIDVNGRRLQVYDNVVADDAGETAGAIVISDGGNATDAGRLVNNQSSTLTFTPTQRENWQIFGNDGVKRWSRGANVIADGATIAHRLSAAPQRILVTTTTSGEFASITATSSTTFTVAIKKHDGTPGTTGNVYWEAEY